MPGLDAGSLDRRIRIERDGPTTHDGLQNVLGAPFVLAEVWAQYKPARGQERFELATREAEIPVAFIIRWSRRVADVGRPTASAIRHAMTGSYSRSSPRLARSSDVSVWSSPAAP